MPVIDPNIFLCTYFWDTSHLCCSCCLTIEKQHCCFIYVLIFSVWKIILVITLHLIIFINLFFCQYHWKWQYVFYELKHFIGLIFLSYYQLCELMSKINPVITLQEGFWGLYCELFCQYCCSHTTPKHASPLRWLWVYSFHSVSLWLILFLTVLCLRVSYDFPWFLGINLPEKLWQIELTAVFFILSNWSFIISMQLFMWYYKNSAVVTVI